MAIKQIPLATQEEISEINSRLNTISDETSQLSESITEISNLFNIDDRCQFLDKNKIVAGYWNALQNFVSKTNGYNAYQDKLILPAGTYYYRLLDISFTTFKMNGVIKKLKEIGGTQPASGSFTLESEAEACITVNYPYNADTFYMLTNFDYQGDEYFYGVLGDGVTIPSLKVLMSQIADYNFTKGTCIVVDANGNGDYDNIQSAIDNCEDSVDNPVTILVMRGTYRRFSMIDSGVVVRHISIIGIDKAVCIVKDTTGDYTTPPAEINTDGVVKNLTFLATHETATGQASNKIQYAVHLDYTGAKNEHFENCDFISYNAPAVGIGITEGQRLRFDNCRFECRAINSEYGENGLGGFYCHASVHPNNSDCGVILNNCEVINLYGNRGIFIDKGGTSGNTPDAQISKCLFIANGNYNAIVNNVFNLKNSYGNCADITRQ